MQFVRLPKCPAHLYIFLWLTTFGCSVLKEQIPTKDEYRTYRVFADVIGDEGLVYTHHMKLNAGYIPVPVVLLLKVRNDRELNEVRNRLSSEGIFVREFIPVNP